MVSSRVESAIETLTPETLETILTQTPKTAYMTMEEIREWDALLIEARQFRQIEEQAPWMFDNDLRDDIQTEFEAKLSDILGEKYRIVFGPMRSFYQGRGAR